MDKMYKRKNILNEVKDTLKFFVMDNNFKVENIIEVQKSLPIDFNDKLLELVPEVYLDQHIASQQGIVEGIDKLVRENAAFEIRNNINDLGTKDEH
jgi:hypothetical protein